MEIMLRGEEGAAGAGGGRGSASRGDGEAKGSAPPAKHSTALESTIARIRSSEGGVGCVCCEGMLLVLFVFVEMEDDDDDDEAVKPELRFPPRS